MADIALVRERLQDMIERRGTNAKEVSLAAGFGATYVRDILTGKSDNPRMNGLEAIAKVLKCNVHYLTGESDNPDIDRELAVEMELAGIDRLLDAIDILSKSEEPRAPGAIEQLVNEARRHLAALKKR